MKSGSALSALKQKLERPANLLRQFFTLVTTGNEQSYVPKAERKSKWTIWRENMVWVAKNKEINRYYYVYGLDRRGSNAQNEIISYKTFRSLRDRNNLRPGGMNFNYACLLRDKFIFGQLMASLQMPTPKNIALLDNGYVTWLDTMETVPLISLTHQPNFEVDGFCKKLTGIKGEGAFPLRVSRGQIYSAGQELSAAQLQQKMSGQYLWQEKVAQHEDVSRLHAASVNTMRILTFNNNGKIKLFSAALRIGTNNRSVDNWGAGGIAVPIDLETGKLAGEGVYKPGFGSRIKHHPDSGITLLGYQLPFFQESLELVSRCHRYLYGIHSIGWDVAITPEGPVLIEANEDWDGSFAMSLEKNFKSRFLKMYSNR
jgi:hypothetical protein